MTRYIEARDEADRSLAALNASLARLRRAIDARKFKRCRVAYIVDGVEGWAPWRPIAEYAALKAAAAKIVAMGEVRAWVERR